MNLAHILVVVLSAYGATFGLYVLFLAYCTLWQMRATGRLAAMPVLARGHCYAILYFVLLWDVLFNILIGTLLFLELPELKRLTFTARCQKHLNTEDAWKGKARYRYLVAAWVCEGWLNPSEPGHC